MRTGIMKWFNGEEGFGFIISVDDGSNLFARGRTSDFQGFREPPEGQKVEFDVT